MTGSRADAHAPHESLDDELEDEALAAAARVRYLRNEFEALKPDRRSRGVLGEAERLLIERDPAAVQHLTRARSRAVSGRLAITDERLILLRRPPVVLAKLDQLDETWVVARRLHVMLTTGAAFAIRTLRPALLRVELAAARAQFFDRQATGSEDGASPPDG
jgi:hypothetical protein